MPKPKIDTAGLRALLRPQLDRLATKHKGDPEIVKAIEAELRRRAERKAAKRGKPLRESPVENQGAKRRPAVRWTPEPPRPGEGELERLRREVQILRRGVTEISELLARWGLSIAATEELETTAMAYWAKHAPAHPDAFGRSRQQLAKDQERLAALRAMHHAVEGSDERHG
jgi:hypothetical protein